MATPAELRHLCLLLAAGGMLYPRRGATLPSSVRCALYLLVAFALRRGNLGRDTLRGTSPRTQAFPSTAGRAVSPFVRLRTVAGRMGALLVTPIGKQASPYVCCG
ncbi:MAG TPA: hypothetical protein VGE04_20615 [Chloroflexia bacterium]